MHWPGEFLTLPAITAPYCRPVPQRFFHSHAFSLLNPDDPFDVVDYWNLRAAGMFLLPLTLQDREAAVTAASRARRLFKNWLKGAPRGVPDKSLF
jgi:hypothetical protein